MTENFKSTSEFDTLEIAASFAKTLRPGTVVALTGELGSGKTVFVKGVARALGVNGEVTSPTFTLINEYSGDCSVYHMDFYRLNNLAEILELGVEEYLYSGNICLVEWAEKMGSYFPGDAVRVTLRHLKNNHREITIERQE